MPAFLHHIRCARASTLVLVGAMLALPSVAASQAQSSAKRALTIEDYYRVLTVGSPDLSPDGRWIAFTVSTRVEETNGNRSEVWLVPADGSARERRVSPAGASASGIQWAPDGQLRFTSAGTSFALPPGAAEAVAIPQPPGARGGAAGAAGGGRGGGGGRGAGGATASSDNAWALSTRAVPAQRVERTFASEFERRHEERFKGVQFDWLDFQRDGAAFPVPDARDPSINPAMEIFIAHLDGSEQRQLTKMGLRPAGANWRPDGKAVVFTADSTYRDESVYGRSDVYTVTLDGTVRKVTANDGYNNTGARYSPNGAWISFTRSYSTDMIIAKKLNHGGPTDLYLMPTSGGEMVNLTQDWDLLPTGPTWSPDSRYLYFMAGIGGSTHLFRVAEGGGAVQQITKGERRIGGLSYSRDFSKIVYTVGLDETPSDIFIANIDGSGEKQLTHVHEAFANEVAISRADRLLFKSKDGTQIEGWITLPYGYRRDGGPYPLIVSSHGGPHSADGYGFDFKTQYFAANGYFVLTTNFRSSTGYGERFLWGTWGAWGNKDGEDVMAGVDYAIANYPIDRQRVGSIGHSYGGFMTNWLITHYPDRFAAAIPGAGITNWISDYGLADIARTKETEFYGPPWNVEAREIMIRQSPLFLANKVKAATLFINGEIDQRVPYEEAEQFFVALKKNGVTAKVIRYADQPHGISGNWNNVHRMLNELRWFDLYLKPRKA